MEIIKFDYYNRSNLQKRTDNQPHDVQQEMVKEITQSLQDNLNMLRTHTNYLANYKSKSQSKRNKNLFATFPSKN